MRIPVRARMAGCALAIAFLTTGCQSPWVEATIVNQQDTPVSLVEVSYPGGTFGVQSIAPHASYNYRFHILADGAASIDFTDAANHAHTEAGPDLQQREQGSLRIEIEPGNHVTWTPALTTRK